MSVTISRDAVVNYLNFLFGYVDFAHEHRGCIVIRGIGEKGTHQEGVFRENEAIRADLGPEYVVEKVVGAIERWGSHAIASFIVPAVMDLRCLDHGKAGDEAVRYFTAFMVDIDKGDTDLKLEHARKYLGRPSLVVSSGGTTETGHKKRHLYWRFREPTPDVERIAAARKAVALKLGGDTSFGRMPQVIRIPGSIYGKSGVQRLCEIEDFTNDEYDA